MFRNMFRKMTAILLSAAMMLTLFAQAGVAEELNAIVGANAGLGNGSSNRDYYTQEEWAKEFPEGTFIVEHSEYTVTEGGDDPENPTDVYLGINVARMGGTASKVNVTFAVNAVTGTETDFSVENNVLTFQPGDTEQTAYIRIPDNALHDSDRLLTFTLVDAEDAHMGKLITAMIRIADDEPYIATELNMTVDPAVDKCTGAATVTLTRTEEQATYLFTVDLQTMDGTAKSGIDYTPVQTTVVFKVGETEKQVGIPLLQSEDKQAHPAVALSVKLSNPKGGSLATDQATIILTDQAADPANAVHNTESMMSDMGDNDQTGEITLDEEDVTQNTGAMTGLNENAEKVSRKTLLRNAMAAFSGRALLQATATPSFWDPIDTAWTSGNRDAQPFINYFNYSCSPDFYVLNSDNVMGGATFRNNGIVGQANVDVLMYTKNTYNMNLYQGFMVKWRNQTLSGAGFHPNTYIGLMYGGSGNSMMSGSSDWPQDKSLVTNVSGNTTYVQNLKFTLSDENDLGKWPYGFGTMHAQYRENYYLDSEDDPDNSRYKNTQPTDYWFKDYTDATFQSKLHSGYKADQMHIFLSVANSNWSDNNNFKVDEVKLYRAFIPFARLAHRLDTPLSYNASTGTAVYNVGADNDQYRVTLTVVPGQGGIKVGTSENDSGIYIGSQVRVSIKPLSGTDRMITASQFKLRNQLSGTVDTVFNRQTQFTPQADGSFLADAAVTLATVGASDGSRALDSRIQDNAQIVVYTEPSAVNYRNVAVDYSGVADNTQVMNVLGNAVKPMSGGNAATHLGLVTPGKDETKKLLTLGSFAFDTIHVDPSVLGAGIRMTSNIPGYTVINSAVDIPFSACPAGTTATFIVQDFTKDYTSPNAVITKRSVSEKSTGTWKERLGISGFTKELMFEDLHPIVGNASRADALTFDLQITNSKNYENRPDKSFPVWIYATDSDENRQTKLFSFVHDTSVERPSLNGDGILNRAVTVQDVDRSYYPEPGGENGYPEVILLAANANSVTYRVYIPSYYDYMGLAVGTRTVYAGGRITEFHMYDYTGSQNTDGSGNPKILRNIQELLVQARVPGDKVTSSEQTAETPQQPGQENLYIYSNDNAAMSLPKLEFDLSSLTALIPKVGGGISPGISLDGDQLTMTLDFSGNPLAKDDGDASSGASSDAGASGGTSGGASGGTSGGGTSGGTSGGASTGSGASGGTSGGASTGSGASGGTSGGASAGSAAASSPAFAQAIGGGDTIAEKVKTLKNAISQIKNKDNFFNALRGSYPKAGADVDFKVNGGVSITLSYDSMMGRWDFSEAVFYLGTEFSVSTTQPFPALPIFYYSLGVKVSAQVGTGFKSLPVGVSASGQVERQIFWSGVTLSPAVYASAGVGIGIADLVCASLTAYIDMGFTVNFGESAVVMGSNTLDLTDDLKDASYSENGWDMVDTKTDAGKAMVTGTYQSTLLQSQTEKATMSFNLKAKSFDLYGKLHAKGAVMKIVVQDQGKNVLSVKYVDTAYERDLPGVKLFSYAGSYLQDLTVTISMDDRPSANNTGKSLLLDHIPYRTMDAAYSYTTTAAAIPNWHVQIGLKFDAKFIVFSYSVDLIYFYVNESGVGWGDPNNKHTLKEFDATASTAKSYRMMRRSNDDSTNTIGSSLGITERYVDFSGRLRMARAAENSYFNLGDYTTNKTVSKIDGAVDGASTSQLVQYNGKTYVFWVDDAGLTARPDTLQRLALLYREVGDDTVHFVEDDGTGDYDFQVFVNAQGKLQVVWTNFRAGAELPDTTDMAALIRAYNSNMEIKTAVMGEDDLFGEATALSDTNDDQNDSTLDVATNGVVDVLSYVKDVKGKYAADVQINNQEFFDPSVKENSQAFTNSIYQGISTNYIAVKTADGTFRSMAVPTGLSETYWKIGTKITSSSLAFLNESTLVLAFAAEIPNAQKEQYLGTNKALFVQYGNVDAEGNITFGDARLVYTVFDYDTPVQQVFADGNIPGDYLHNGTLYDNPVLAQVQFEQVNMPSAEENVDTRQLTLFFKVNDQIRYFDEGTLRSVGGLSNEPKVMKVIELSVNDYTLQTDADGTLYLLYERSDETSYDSMIRVKTFRDGLWSQERTLTMSTAYDELLFKNQLPTGAANFSQLSSVVDAQGNLLLLMQASYRPFNYDGYIIDQDGNEITVPYLDESPSAGAKRELYLLQFSQPETKVVGEAPVLSTNLLKPGYTVNVTVGLNNVGDTTVENLRVELLVDEIAVASKDLSGAFVPGATQSVKIPYAVKTGEIANGSLLHYRVYSGSTLLYESKTDTAYTPGSTDSVSGGRINAVTLYTDKAELYFEETRMTVNDQNEVSFSGILLNDGYAQLTKNPVVQVEVMRFDEQLQYYVLDTDKGENGVIASAEIDKSLVDGYISSGLYYNVTGRFALPDYLQNSKFVLRMHIVYGEETADNEYSKDNNYSRNFSLYPATRIVLGYEAQDNIVNVEVGDVLELSDLQVLSTVEGIDRAHLSIREVGTSCLSIDSVSPVPRIKVMSATADEGTTVVRVAFSVDGTAVSQSLLLNISRSKTINLTGNGTNDGLTYTGNWLYFTGTAQTPVGGYKNDVIQSSGGGTIALQISGATAFSLTGTRRPGGGTATISVKETGADAGTDYTVNTDGTLAAELLLFEKTDLSKDKTYDVTISVPASSAVTLDTLVIDGLYGDRPATEAFNLPQKAEKDLGLPIVDGRNRKATVTLQFATPVKLAAEADLSKFALEFTVNETDTATGETTEVGTQLLTFEELQDNGLTAVFTADKLASRAGKVRVYTLADKNSPEGYLESVNGSVLLRSIPNAAAIAFELTETGIRQVKVVNDPDAPAGTVGKALAVTFEKPMDSQRLDGTTILYQNQLVFTFAAL